ncbi:MAG: hypothetical protein F6J94_32445 [Moorea sp. SIO1F2]|uniref:hypothetical protein n=1 Tax=unclassified Moorena TaxID=2683338 RepID=UPI0013B95685|nr:MULTISPECIES: hypothetical protein [unclassified Moorena]NEO01750.1 hypothetical protein [Moorena sp. SIO3I7]NEO10520.1 hypothetical protein [Moorena sp. SIO3I8]NEO18736.1 hypothetical protein [Moorena sp. SIO4A5]NEP28537.1 hypothetical protein [Moorena sp. SIO3I6]NEQ58054.1 hypothetical protein [Moorena sp. SIO4A1]
MHVNFCLLPLANAIARSAISAYGLAFGAIGLRPRYGISPTGIAALTGLLLNQD